MRICEFPIRAVRCGLVLPGPGGASSGFDSLRPYLFVSDAPLFIQSVPRQRHSRFSCHPSSYISAKIVRRLDFCVSCGAIFVLFCFAWSRGTHLIITRFSFFAVALATSL